MNGRVRDGWVFLWGFIPVRVKKVKGLIGSKTGRRLAEGTVKYGFPFCTIYMTNDKLSTLYHELGHVRHYYLSLCTYSGGGVYSEIEAYMYQAQRSETLAGRYEAINELVDHLVEDFGIERGKAFYYAFRIAKKRLGNKI